ncbi:MAG TPA: glutaminyl-peptide cyclotransferase [Blastocatellia bacterium]|nr:glutaminyl-peptide cyclotransferase [Blastocatellia bacterium]
MARCLGVVLILLGAEGIAGFAPRTQTLTLSPTLIYTYQIVNVYPHDRTAFTQGLVYDNGVLYESTGLYGQSSLRQVELETGKVLKLYRLPENYFGEGLTLWKDTLIQLTWREQVGWVYDKESFQPLRQFTYRTEGWGLTHDGQHLIMSDGTATLRFLDPETFKEVKRLVVRDRGVPVSSLNELEFVKGEIYANVWLTERVARISPKTGRVLAWIHLAGLLTEEDRRPPVDVLNGIAYDAAGDRLFVTGKLWPKLFEIKLIPKRR